MTLVLPELAPQLSAVASTSALVGGVVVLAAILLGTSLAMRLVRALPPDTTFSVRLGPGGVRLGMARGGGDDSDRPRPPVPETWQEFAGDNHPELLGDTAKICLSVGLSPNYIEDVYQESVIALGEKWARARMAKKGPRVYMRGIIRKKALDAKYGRGKNGQFNAAVADLPDEAAAGLSTWISAEDEASQVQQLEELFRDIRALPKRQREVVIYVEVLGYSIGETADELTITQGAVRQARSEAKKTLQARRNNDS